MTVRDHVMKENSRKNWLQSVIFIGTDKKRVTALMQLFFSKDIRQMQVSSQVVSELGDKHPQLIQPYLAKMIANLETNPIDAFKRVTIRFCQFNDVPSELEGAVFNFGIRYLKSADESIAVKAFSMTALRRICEKYPELSAELIPHIELLVEEKASAGIVNRGQKELKKLYALQAKL